MEAPAWLFYAFLAIAILASALAIIMPRVNLGYEPQISLDVNVVWTRMGVDKNIHVLLAVRVDRNATLSEICAGGFCVNASRQLQPGLNLVKVTLPKYSTIYNKLVVCLSKPRVCTVVPWR